MASMDKVQSASMGANKCVAEQKGLSEQRRTAARLLWEKVITGSMVASKFISILTSRRQTYAQVDEDGRVFWQVKLMFAAPQFALIPLTLLINVFIIKFYLDDIGVSAAFIAFFQIFSRSFDVLTGNHSSISISKYISTSYILHAANNRINMNINEYNEYIQIQ